MAKNENIQLDMDNTNFVSINSNQWFSWKVIFDLKHYHTIEIRTDDDDVYDVDKEKALAFLVKAGIVHKLETKPKQSARSVLPRDEKGRFIKRK